MQARFKKVWAITGATVGLILLAAYSSPVLAAASSGKDAVVSRVALIPEAGTLILLGSGLLSLAGVVRRRFRNPV